VFPSCPLTLPRTKPSHRSLSIPTSNPYPVATPFISTIPVIAATVYVTLLTKPTFVHGGVAAAVVNVPSAAMTLPSPL